MPTSYISIWGISRFAYKIYAILIRYTCARLPLSSSPPLFYFSFFCRAHIETTYLFESGPASHRSTTKKQQDKSSSRHS